MPDRSDRLTTTVPAIALTGADLILRHPDTGEDVVWQLTGRREERGADRYRPVVVVDYFVPGDPSGVEGTHEFDDCQQLVTVRVPRYQPAAA